MPAEILTVKRVFLKPKNFWKSAHHTARICPGQNPNDPNSNAETLSLEFRFGVARNVPVNVYDAFAAAGIATKDKPRFDDDPDDEDEA